MKCQCPSCQVAFSIPDEKIPEGKALKILCPKCKVPIELKGASENDDADRTEAQRAGGSESSVPSPSPMESLRTDESLVDMVEEGVKTALLCTSDSLRAVALEQVLGELDYYVVRAPKASTAIGKLRLNRYDMVILDDSFEGVNASGNLLLQHIQLLPMHVRRQFFMCLLSQQLPSYDRALAFRLGVDMILNMRDMGKFKLILVNSIKDHKAFYRVFRDELSKKG